MLTKVAWAIRRCSGPGRTSCATRRLAGVSASAPATPSRARQPPAATSSSRAQAARAIPPQCAARSSPRRSELRASRRSRATQGRPALGKGHRQAPGRSPSHPGPATASLSCSRPACPPRSAPRAAATPSAAARRTPGPSLQVLSGQLHGAVLLAHACEQGAASARHGRSRPVPGSSTLAPRAAL